MDLKTAPLLMTILVVNTRNQQILVADLVRLVADTVMNIVELVVHQLMLYFVVEIVVFPYADIIM